ncbi:MAG: hypothetical protein ABEJ95_01175 [Candidatus Nanohalobium sp.]
MVLDNEEAKWDEEERQFQNPKDVKHQIRDSYIFRNPGEWEAQVEALTRKEDKAAHNSSKA